MLPCSPHFSCYILYILIGLRALIANLFILYIYREQGKGGRKQPWELKYRIIELGTEIDLRIFLRDCWFTKFYHDLII
jgi:hypothetical protein